MPGGPVLPVGAPPTPDVSPTGASVVDGPVLVVLTVIARYTSATTIRELWGEEKGLLLTSPGGYLARLGPHSKVTGRERESMHLGFCLYWG